MSENPLSPGEPESHPPRHRRDGVPLDGAPDLGLYTAPAPVISDPVTTSTWVDPGQYLAPSSVPPEFPASPTVSEYQYPAEDPVEGSESPGEGPGA